ncbi:MAG: porin family protein [Bacteroidales bacterium]
MKRLWLILIGITLFSNVQAQEKTKQRVTFGLRAGINFSDIVSSNQDDLPLSVFSHSDDYKSKIGGRIGIVADIDHHLYVQPGLYYSYKRIYNHYFGYQTVENIEVSEMYTLQYLELPILISYHLPIGKNSLNFSAGPYFGYGLQGKITMQEKYYNKTTNTSLDINGTTHYFKDNQTSLYATDNQTGYTEKIETNNYAAANRFDFGVSVAVGFEISKFYIGVGYDIGIYNTGAQKFWDAAGMKKYKQHNMNFQATVGYNF